MFSELIKDSINRCVLCWLATTSAGGVPNVSPKEVFVNFGDSNLLIGNIASPQSIRNINENENVCVSFIDVFVQKGYKLIGTASIVRRSDQDFEKLVEPLILLAGEGFPISSVINIKVTSIKKITAPKYILFPNTTEDEQIKSAMKSYRVKPI